VAVRKIEAVSPTIWLPTLAFAALGILLEWFSLITPHFLLSTAFGILGFTLLWDALEFTRQQNRIKKGHAPANPNSSATTLDLLKRDPVGKPVSHREAIQLVTDH
jgi:hypothetical protein